jgi:hypothetical protein
MKIHSRSLIVKRSLKWLGRISTGLTPVCVIVLPRGPGRSLQVANTQHALLSTCGAFSATDRTRYSGKTLR